MVKTYNLFISHSWTYGDAYEKLCGMLDEANYFSYKNFSVPKDDPVHNAKNIQELYDAIKRRVSPCSAVLIMAGKYASYSKWIQREIQIATSEFTDAKPIIGIRPWANLQTSKPVQDNADTIVGWRSDSIVKAIREYAI